MKTVTYSSPNGSKITLTLDQIAELDRLCIWPRDAQGQEYNRIIKVSDDTSTIYTTDLPKKEPAMSPYATYLFTLGLAIGITGTVLATEPPTTPVSDDLLTLHLTPAQRELLSHAAETGISVELTVVGDTIEYVGWASYPDYDEPAEVDCDSFFMTE